MPITINGSGTITGVSVGGLPDGIVDKGTLAGGSSGPLLNCKTTLYTSSADIAADSGNWQAGPFSVTITPASASSKILVLCHVTGGVGSGDNGEGPVFQIQRSINGAAFAASDGIGAAYGSTSRGTTGGLWDFVDDVKTALFSVTFVDSPNTTSAVEYKPYFHVHNGPLKINRVDSSRDGSPEAISGTSSITVIEVAT